jgi:flagellar motor switch protein FliM
VRSAAAGVQSDSRDHDDRWGKDDENAIGNRGGVAVTSVLAGSLVTLRERLLSLTAGDISDWRAAQTELEVEGVASYQVEFGESANP